MFVYIGTKDMKKSIDTERIEPESWLYIAILERIESEKRHLAKVRLVYTSIIGTLSLFTLLSSVSYFANEFSQSGFYQYLRLIFSDGGSLFPYWKELSLSLAESLPIIGTVTILTSILVLLTTSKYIAKDVKTVLVRSRFA